MTTTRRWPGALVELDVDPRGAAPRWAEHVQGATSGGGCWFVTQIDRIWRFPLDLDLDQAERDDQQVAEAPIPEPGVDHLGDADLHGGRLHVAMEGTTPARIGLFDPELAFLGSAEVAEQGGSCPWCAVDPGDGLLWSSPFTTDHLCAYQPVNGPGSFTLRHVRDVRLRDHDGAPLRLERVQGGAFAGDGQLYLSSDAADEETRGLHGIDVGTGRRMLHRHLPADDGVVEGLAVDDLRSTLHVLVLQRRDDRTDRVWFRRFGLDP